MTEKHTKCSACDGRGYFYCDCHPADCICGVGEETCDECGGEGIIDPSYDYLDAPSPQPNVVGEPHPDDLAVDRFAAVMKAKLAQKRAEGRGGWDNPDECSIEWLSELLRSHVEKADPVDVGNFAMMIHQRGGRICK